MAHHCAGAVTCQDVYLLQEILKFWTMDNFSRGLLGFLLLAPKMYILSELVLMLELGKKDS
jgi:hypothetical protein